MPLQARLDYLAIIWQRYQDATMRHERAFLLTEAQTITGLSRAHLCRMLNKIEPPARAKPGGPRKRRYLHLTPLLARLWRELDKAGGRKLKAAMPLWLPNFDCPLSAKRELLAISASEIDRLLKPVRAQARREGNTGTKPAASRIKTSVPIRPQGAPAQAPGQIEADTVAHCGGSLSGAFFWTLTATDLFSRWTECRAVWNKEGKRVKAALDDIESKLPFRMSAFFTDGGTEFLNADVVEGFCRDKRREEPIFMARGRPKKKNDQAYVEQKNNTHVRHLLGYGRLDLGRLQGVLDELYVDWCLKQNHFVPQVSLQSKERNGARIKRRYSPPQTPFERLMSHADVGMEQKGRLLDEHRELCPFELNRRIRSRLKYIHRLLDIEANLQGRAAS